MLQLIYMLILQEYQRRGVAKEILANALGDILLAHVNVYSISFVAIRLPAACFFLASCLELQGFQVQADSQVVDGTLLLIRGI